MAQGISLGARHLLKIPESEYLLASTVKAAQVAVEIFLSTTPGEQGQLHLSDLGSALPGIYGIRRLIPAFVLTDHPTPFAGGSSGDDWIMGINETLVMKFEGVSNPNEYVARQLQVIEGWCTEHDARLGAVRGGGPFRAFIVMPFEEQWSSASRAFIEHAISLVDSEIVADRADDIDDPGSITEQIVNRLEEADLVISDITGNNANVGWELGFAYARSKPCVIIRRRETLSAPFDIYDQRRVDYSPDPTVAEAQGLKRMIEAAIEQVKSAAVSEDLGSHFKGS
jgi:nucleoside 2-deoxyribosyltransferase